MTLPRKAPKLKIVCCHGAFISGAGVRIAVSVTWFSSVTISTTGNFSLSLAPFLSLPASFYIPSPAQTVFTVIFIRVIFQKALISKGNVYFT